MEPIKLYVGQQYREPKLSTHIDLLFPFWGVAVKDTMPYVRRAAEKFVFSPKDFALVNRIEDADFVLVPYNYERLKSVNPERLKHILNDAEKAGKPVLIDAAGDIERPLPDIWGVVLRVGPYRYNKAANEIVVPYATEDLLEKYQNSVLVPRTKRMHPSVGFVGWSNPDMKTWLRAYVRDMSTIVAGILYPERGAERKGLFFRARALRALRKNRDIETDVVMKRSYSGHVGTLEGDVEENRQRFVQNLLTTDYALCVRGDANASVRFYEALSLGRIPLFLDTACVLPLEDTINYREFCVFVDWRNVDSVDAALLEFHKTVTPERFVRMQEQARDTYRRYLRRDSFSRELAQRLRAWLEQEV